MRATSKLLALAFTAALQPAMAGTVFLDFEDVQTVEKLTNRYSNLGVAVTGDAFTATSKACKYGAAATPGKVGFQRDGSCGAVWLAADPTDVPTGDDNSLTFNLADGFINSLSFVYSANTGSPGLSIHLFDAAGRELGLGLDGLSGSPCGNFPFCNWQSVNLSFQGVARSVVFTALDQSIILDDLRFTTPAATGQLPEPTSIALVVGALAGLGWARKRAAR